MARVTLNDETLKEQIIEILVDVYKDSCTFDAILPIMRAVELDRERAVREAVNTTIKRERDRSFTEHMKVQEFYAGSKQRLKELAFPSHCSSCHSEWEDGYGGEEPCCSRAKSNIIDNIMKWHINESADEIKKVKAQLSNPTQEKEGE